MNGWIEMPRKEGSIESSGSRHNEIADLSTQFN
jgi:hypothetical protein